jgi:23S rRNA (pseudouridine1915-N3)-methyltransferase
VRIHLVAVGTRMPGWVDHGYAEYARRLPRTMPLHLTEIASAPRGRGRRTAAAKDAEGKRTLAALAPSAHVVALDEGGAPWSTRELAGFLERRMQAGTDLALLIGGPDGLGASCLERADARWSLSALTLPHGLVRIIVAEQLYRAWSLLGNHPYHRD